MKDSISLNDIIVQLTPHVQVVSQSFSAGEESSTHRSLRTSGIRFGFVYVLFIPKLKTLKGGAITTLVTSAIIGCGRLT